MTLKILHWMCRLGLAGLFVFAGLTKLYPPDQQFLFEIAVSSYQLLPSWAVIVVARTLPWLEIGLGVFLLVGWQLRYFATFAAFLLSGFMTVMSVSYVRGIEADCGCFGLGEPISPTTLARDAVFFVIAIFLAAYAWRIRRARFLATT